MSYFNDYKDIEVRNKKLSMTESIKKKKAETAEDPEDAERRHMITLMMKEKERRLKELPKLRPHD